MKIIKPKNKLFRLRGTIPGIFWREKGSLDSEPVLCILMKRAPELIPRMVSRKTANLYIRHGKTSLERKVRKSLIDGLYGS